MADLIRHKINFFAIKILRDLRLCYDLYDH
jgi:hypothetical protein